MAQLEEKITIMSMGKGQKLTLPLNYEKLYRLRRCVSHLNSQALKKRDVEEGQSQYSVFTNKDTNTMEVVRNY